MAVSRFSDILTETSRWPTDGDHLFEVSPHPADDAHLEPDWYARMCLMAEGYKNTADLLVAQTKESALRRDKLVYPIVFCYRHYIELTLKAMLATYGPIAGVATNWKDHDLRKLWTGFKKILDFYMAGDQEADGVVEACILEFSTIDENSFSFRYPTTRDGRTVLFGRDRLDLDRLQDVMAGLYGYFTGNDAYLTELQETHAQSI